MATGQTIQLKRGSYSTSTVQSTILADGEAIYLRNGTVPMIIIGDGSSTVQELYNAKKYFVSKNEADLKGIVSFNDVDANNRASFKFIDTNGTTVVGYVRHTDKGMEISDADGSKKVLIGSDSVELAYNDNYKIIVKSDNIYKVVNGVQSVIGTAVFVE